MIAPKRRGSGATAESIAEVAARVAVAEVARQDRATPSRPKRLRGRARAEVASKSPVIEGPSSGRRPTLSPGTKLVRVFKGRRITVVCTEKGFEWDGKFYRSLSAVANAITGQHVSGVAWFGLRPRGRKERGS